MTIDIDKLEAIAKAAQERSPGEWTTGRTSHPDIALRVYAWSRDPIDACDVVVSDCLHRQDAEHIAAFSPDAVLKLLERIRELEGENSVMWADKNAAMMRKSDIPRSLYDDEKGKRLAAEVGASQMRSKLNAAREFIRGLQDAASPIGPAAEAVLNWLGEP